MSERKKIITLGEGPSKKPGPVSVSEIATIEARFGARKLRVDILPEQLRPSWLAMILDAEVVLATLLHVAAQLKASSGDGVIRMARIKAMRAKLVELGVDEEILGSDPHLAAKIDGEAREILAHEVDYEGNILLDEMQPPGGAGRNGG